MDKLKNIGQKLAMILAISVILIGAYATFFVKKDADAQINNTISSNSCSDKDKAIVNFRAGCEPSTGLGFSANWQIREKWCKCVEKKFDVREFLDANCSEPNAGNLMKVWNSNQVKAACGTPAEPIE